MARVHQCDSRLQSARSTGTSASLASRRLPQPASLWAPSPPAQGRKCRRPIRRPGRRETDRCVAPGAPDAGTRLARRSERDFQTAGKSMVQARGGDVRADGARWKLRFVERERARGTVRVSRGPRRSSRPPCRESVAARAQQASRGAIAAGAAVRRNCGGAQPATRGAPGPQRRRCGASAVVRMSRSFPRRNPTRGGRGTLPLRRTARGARGERREPGAQGRARRSRADANCAGRVHPFLRCRAPARRNLACRKRPARYSAAARAGAAVRRYPGRCEAGHPIPINCITAR